MLIMGFVLELLFSTHAHNVTHHKEKQSKQMLTNIGSLKAERGLLRSHFGLILSILTLLNQPLMLCDVTYGVIKPYIPSLAYVWWDHSWLRVCSDAPKASVWPLSPHSVSAFTTCSFL